MSFKETIREDGLRVITKKVPGTKRVCLGVVAGFGSAYDPPETDGLAHFFEHMALKGTTTRTAADISKVADRYFLESNAATGHLTTVFWGEAVYLYCETLCSVLLDMYKNPIFPASEIDKEREVVNNEIAMYASADDYKVSEGLGSLLWQDNPLRRFGVGTPGGVNSIGRDDLVGTHKHWYVPSNTTLIGVGKIDHERLLGEASKALSWDCSKVAHPDFKDAYREPILEREVVLARPGRGQAVIAVGCKLPPFDEKDQTVFRVLNRIIGGGQNSLLWQEIREKRGLSYSVWSHFDTATRRLGYHFSCQAEVLPNRIANVKQLLINAVCDFPLEREAFESSREAMRDHWLASVESPQLWMWTIINKVLNEGQDVSYLDNYVQKQRSMLSNVTFGEVVELRNKVLTPDNIACSIVKPA